MSLLTTPVALTDLLFVPEYWQPITLFSLPVGLEGFLFCFATGGLGAVLYEEILRKKVIKSTGQLREKNLRSRFLIFVGVVVVLLLRLLTPCNFMHAILLGALVSASVIVALRRDLFPAVIFSGLFFAILYTLIFVSLLQVFPDMLSMWALENLSQISFVEIPVEEVLWAFLAGAILGSFYEFWKGYRLVPLH